MADGFATGNNGNEAHNEFREAQADAKLPEPSVLENVLQETISSDADDIPPEQMEALRVVASRHQRDAFAVEPVGVALVESILTLRVTEYRATEQKWRDMSQQIAAAFFDSPAAVARLERLWNRLCASTS